MDFLETPGFPACPSFGFTARPMYSNRIVRVESGRERRNRVWARPLLMFECSVTDVEEDIYALLEFWHAVGGTLFGFRFNDPSDNLSCALGGDPAPLDQPLVAIDGSPATWQLVKRYTRGALSQDRDIVKPIAATIRVANELGVEQPGTAWTLDDTTGVITPNGGFSGTPATWGGEFDVPVRFDSEFPIEIIQRRVQSVSFTLAELRL